MRELMFRQTAKLIVMESDIAPDKPHRYLEAIIER
jgi:hypothetical protein